MPVVLCNIYGIFGTLSFLSTVIDLQNDMEGFGNISVKF